MRSLLFAMLLLFSISGLADIYVQTDQNGNQTYSDTPTPGAQRLILPGTVTNSATHSATTTTPAPMAAFPQQGLPAAQSALAGAVYTDFQIASPVDQQTITNQRDIPVTLTIKPALQKGDKTQLYLDGAAVGTPAETATQSLSNVDRGTHTVSAVLLGSNNRILKQSQTITIFIHYAALGGAVAS